MTTGITRVWAHYGWILIRALTTRWFLTRHNSLYACVMNCWCWSKTSAYRPICIYIYINAFKYWLTCYRIKVSFLVYDMICCVTCKSCCGPTVSYSNGEQPILSCSTYSIWFRSASLYKEKKSWKCAVFPPPGIGIILRPITHFQLHVYITQEGKVAQGQRRATVLRKTPIVRNASNCRCFGASHTLKANSWVTVILNEKKILSVTFTVLLKTWIRPIFIENQQRYICIFISSVDSKHKQKNIYS